MTITPEQQQLLHVLARLVELKTEIRTFACSSCFYGLPENLRATLHTLLVDLDKNQQHILRTSEASPDKFLIPKKHR